MLRLNEKLSIDLIKDLKEISICFTNVKVGFVSIGIPAPLVFINGNFKSKDAWLSFIKSLSKDITGQEGKISSISIKGEEKTVFTAGKIQFIFRDCGISW